MNTLETLAPKEPERYDSQGRRLCTAHRTDGEPCRGPAMAMQAVCRVHGGSAPQARAAAQRRLVSLVDPALDSLEQALAHGNTTEQIRAAEAILDRAGITRTANLDVTLTSEHEVKVELLAHLKAFTEREEGNLAPLALTSPSQTAHDEAARGQTTN